MGRKALIALAAVLVLSVAWMWPSLSEPAHEPCINSYGDGFGTWGYDVLTRTWECGEWNVKVGRYAVPGI